jgi:ornithine carbamoyltransferase
MGFELRLATPKGYECDPEIFAEAQKLAETYGGTLKQGHDPRAAVEGADVVTTDTWVSMGQEDEKEKRIRDFSGFKIDRAMMDLAKTDAIFLHCLPAYRGYEVSDDVFEEHAEEIFSEAENRLHAQKGIMVWLDRQRDAGTDG